MFLKAYNQLMGNREQVIADCRLMLGVVADCSKLDAEIGKANEEITAVSKMIGNCIRENATKALSQEEYEKEYGNLVKRFEKVVGRLDKLNTEKADRVNRGLELRGFIDSLRNSPLVLDTWDEQLWTLLVVKGTVHQDGSIAFEFVGGERIEVENQ